MDITTLLQFVWVAWLVLIVLFLVIEMFTLEFTFLMLGIASLLGLVTALFGGPLWLQLVLAAVAGVLLIFLLKPPLLRRLRRGADEAKSNVDALIGIAGIVVQTTTATEGRVKLSNGDVWTARTHGLPLAPETPVTVTVIRGALAEVVPARIEGTYA